MTEDRKAQLRRFAAKSGAEWSVSGFTETGAFKIENRGLLDEIFVDHWLHLENLDERHWWLKVGNVGMNIEIGEDSSIEVMIGEFGELTSKKTFE